MAELNAIVDFLLEQIFECVECTYIMIVSRF